MSKEDLPYALSDWFGWLRRLEVGKLYYRSDFKDAVASMPEAIVKELGEFYRSAARPENLTSLSDWLSSRNDQPPQSDETELRNLIRLFGNLGQQQWKPFNDYLISESRLPVPKRDWRKLPQGFEFLSEPAERFSRFQYSLSEEGRDLIRANVTPEERSELEVVASRMAHEGYNKINEWRRQLGVGEHVEASMVFNLIAVMDALELRYF